MAIAEVKRGGQGRVKVLKVWWRSIAGLGLPVAIHQGDDVDGDVVPGAQPVVGYPPASVLQDPSRSHYQVLGSHRVPEVTRE